MNGILLDTHALYWIVTDAMPLAEDALIAITKAQDEGALFVSPITAWELSIALQKPVHRNPPNLGDHSVRSWFREALRQTDAKIIPVRQRICEIAADVPVVTGHRDPGDCFLLATAKLRKIPLLTRDATIQRIAERHPGYISVMGC